MNQPVTNAPGEQKPLSIALTQHSLDVLSRRLYSNPLQAAVREYLTNAWEVTPDLEHKPIVVRPTVSHPVYSIRDFGPGLSPDAVNDYFCTFFATTKQFANGIGGFGLGCKTGLAISESLTVTSVHNGLKNTYVVYKEHPDTGLPGFTLMASTATKDHTGLTVQVPVNNAGDISKIHEILDSLEPMYPLEACTEAPLALTIPKDGVSALFTITTWATTPTGIVIGHQYPLPTYSLLHSAIYNEIRRAVLAVDKDDTFLAAKAKTLMRLTRGLYDELQINLLVPAENVAPNPSRESLDEGSLRKLVNQIEALDLTADLEFVESMLLSQIRSVNKKSTYEREYTLRSQFSWLRQTHKTTKNGVVTYASKDEWASSLPEYYLTTEYAASVRKVDIAYTYPNSAIHIAEPSDFAELTDLCLLLALPVPEIDLPIKRKPRAVRNNAFRRPTQPKYADLGSPSKPRIEIGLPVKLYLDEALIEKLRWRMEGEIPGILDHIQVRVHKYQKEVSNPDINLVYAEDITITTLHRAITAHPNLFKPHLPALDAFYWKAHVALSKAKEYYKRQTMQLYVNEVNKLRKRPLILPSYLSTLPTLTAPCIDDNRTIEFLLKKVYPSLAVSPKP